jgi:hypothetical protein
MLINELYSTPHQQLDEIDWKSIQKKAGQIGKGAQQFTKNVAKTGDAVAGAANAIGGAGKELGKQLVARPVGATYNAVKGGLNKAADVAKGVYGDVKTGVQKVGQAGATVGTDIGTAGTAVGKGLQSVGRGVANVAGGVGQGVGATVGGATTGLGRATAKGFNTGVKNVGGGAADRLQTNVFKQTKQPASVAGATAAPGQAVGANEIPTQTGAVNPATGRAYVPSDFSDEVPATPAAGGGQPTAPAAPAPTAPAGGRVSVQQAKQAVDNAVSTISKVRNRDKQSAISYATKAVSKIPNTPAKATPTAPAAKPATWTGRSVAPGKVSAPPAAGAPTAGERANLDQKIQAALAKQPVAESLTWSKSFDPSRALLKQIQRS